MKVLVITTEPDAHLDHVRELAASIDFVVIDPNKFPDEFDLSFEECNGKYLPASIRVDLSNIDAVWHRKPTFKQYAELTQVQKKYRKMARSSYYNFVTGIYALLRNKLWISDWWAIKKAESKLYQLEIAQENGMLVPPTLITNNPEKALQFCKNVGRAVVKSLSDELVEDKDTAYALFTTRVDTDEDFSNLDLNPSIFQKEIADGTDIRVTVVENEIFPAEIIKYNNLTYESDWRLGIGTDNFAIRQHDVFPDQLKTKCVQIVQEMGLKFGAIDLIKDKNGDYWFLEINPNGQWLFIEEMSGMPITQAFIRLFKSAI